MLWEKRALCRILSSGWLALAAALSGGCQEQEWSRKTSHRWWWLSQGGSIAMERKDSGKLDVEQTGFPEVWDVESGRKRRI